MKRKLMALSRRYGTALQEYLRAGARAGLQPALAVGRQAATLDLETLDLARMHEAALATLKTSGIRDGLLQQAEGFFAEAVTPIEKTHRAARQADLRLGQLSRMLSRRTVDLAASRRSLKQGIVQRKSVQQALTQSGEHSRKLLKESHVLQKHLQRLTHRILSAQENKRKQVSRDLHNEIAQTLLSINVRLLTLKREAAVNAHTLKKEIVSTQRLVDKSVKSIKRFAREFGIHHPRQTKA